MELLRTYEKYGEKALEPLKASFPMSRTLFEIFGKNSLIILSALAASSPNPYLNRLGDLGLKYTLSQER